MNLRRHKGRRQHMLTLFSSAEMCWFNSPSYLRIFGHCSTKLSREARLWPPNDGAKGSSLREDPEDRNENFLNGCFWSVQFRSWGRSNRYQHPLSAILRSLSLCRTLQLSLSLSSLTIEIAASSSSSLFLCLQFFALISLQLIWERGLSVSEFSLSLFFAVFHLRVIFVSEAFMKKYFCLLEPTGLAYKTMATDKEKAPTTYRTGSLV